MREFSDLMIEKYFGLLAGILLLATILLGMQTAANLGLDVNQKTINIGWLMVLVWTLVITVISLVHIMKSTEEGED